MTRDAKINRDFNKINEFMKKKGSKGDNNSNNKSSAGGGD